MLSDFLNDDIHESKYDFVSHLNLRHSLSQDMIFGVFNQNNVNWHKCANCLCIQYLNYSILIPDVDECRIVDLCQHNGSCINNNGSFICNCSDGWQGKLCEDGEYKILKYLHLNTYIFIN